MTNNKHRLDASYSKDFKTNLDPEQVLILSYIFLQIVSFIGILVSHGKLWRNIIWSGGSTAVFPDFVETVFQSYGLKPYDTGAIYPAIVYIIFSVFTFILPRSLFLNESGEFAYSYWSSASIAPPIQIVSILFFTFSIILLFCIVRKYQLKNQTKYNKSLIWIIFTSVPLLYTLERGNILLLVISPLICFCLFYNSNSLKKRIFAYICLSFVVSFKVYPVLLGLLILLDNKNKLTKKLFNTVLCIAIGLIVFVFPFVFLDGFDSFMQFIKNIAAHTSRSANNFGLGDKIDISNTLGILAFLFNKQSSNFIELCKTFFPIIILLLGMLGAWLNKEDWKRCACLIIATILFPSFSVKYNTFYLVIPLILFFKNKNSNRIINYIYSIIFAFCFAPFAFGPENLYTTNEFICKLNLGTIVPSFTLVIFLFVLFVDGILCRTMNSNRYSCSETVSTPLKDNISILTLIYIIIFDIKEYLNKIKHNSIESNSNIQSHAIENEKSFEAKTFSHIFNTVNIFKFGLIFLLLLTIIQIPFNNAEVIYSMLHSDTNDTFMDFFNSIFDAVKENPYVERGIIYPPLTQLYYRACALLLPEGFTSFEWRTHQSGYILITVNMIISYLLLYKSLIPEGKENNKSVKNFILLLLFGTVPFWYAFERANIILLTLAFLAYFVKYYNSDNKFKCEFSLICLAISVAFKIYPVCFGILLLNKKHIFKALRCCVYGVIFFFVPFAFVGGISSIKTLIDNIANTTNIMTNNGWGYKLNVDNTVSFICNTLNISSSIGIIVKLVTIVAIVLIVLFAEKHWQKLMALSSIMILIPGFSYTYTMIFASLPLIAFLVNNPTNSHLNRCYSFLFVCMFAPFPFGGYSLLNNDLDSYYQLNMTTIVSSIAILLIIFVISCDVIYSLINTKRFSLQKTVVAENLEL